LKIKGFLLVSILTVFCLASIAGIVGCTSNPLQPTTTTPSDVTRTITDMFGREVTVPPVINNVLACGLVEMELIYMLAPDKLAGMSSSFNGNPALVKEEYASLPVVGGWSGALTGNYETFIAAEPDVIIDGDDINIADRQSKFGDIPVVGVDTGDLLFDYEKATRFLGELLGVEEKAEALIDYYQDAMLYVYDAVSDIPENERVRVYYAEGKEGFNTDPPGSIHTMLLDFCGGINVADVTLLPGYGMAEASMEQILIWDPDLIIIGRGSQASLYQAIMNDQRWAGLRAVQEGKVILRPDNPFSWFDGPPGPCQILGMYWMVNLLYPEQTQDLDLNAKIEEFYSDYLHYDLTPAEIENLLSNPS
jgi:iron complex transport system substrate-binding protein